MFVAKKFCNDKLTFATTNTFLSWQNTSFVVTKVCLLRQNIIFVMASILLLWQKMCFVMANTSLSQQKNCCDKHVFAQQKLYLWQLLPVITDRWTKQFQSTPVTSLWWMYYAKARRNLCRPTEGQLFHLAHICGNWEEDLTHMSTVYDDTKSLLVCPRQCLLWITPPFVFIYIWPQPLPPPLPPNTHKREEKKSWHNSVVVKSVKSKEEGDLDCDCSFWPGPNNWNLTSKSVGTMVEL